MSYRSLTGARGVRMAAKERAPRQDGDDAPRVKWHRGPTDCDLVLQRIFSFGTLVARVESSIRAPKMWRWSVEVWLGGVRQVGAEQDLNGRKRTAKANALAALADLAKSLRSSLAHLDHNASAESRAAALAVVLAAYKRLSAREGR